MPNTKINAPPDLIPLVPGYIQRREEELDILVQRLAARDFDKIYAIAHKLTGNGAGYGMPAISALGQELGDCAKAGNAPDILQCIVRLREVIKDIKNKWRDRAA